MELNLYGHESISTYIEKPYIARIILPNSFKLNACTKLQFVDGNVDRIFIHQDKFDELLDELANEQETNKNKTKELNILENKIKKLENLIKFYEDKDYL